MSKDRWYFQKELKDLCVKCTSLSESTAKKYAQNLFNKFSQKDGCIGWYSDENYNTLTKKTAEYRQALNTLKQGFIQSRYCSLRLEDVTHINFKENEIIVTTKQNEKHSYSNDFKFLKHIF